MTIATAQTASKVKKLFTRTKRAYFIMESGWHARASIDIFPPENLIHVVSTYLALTRIEFNLHNAFGNFDALSLKMLGKNLEWVIVGPD